jgi:hypothetical protein
MDNDVTLLKKQRQNTQRKGWFLSEELSKSHSGKAEPELSLEHLETATPWGSWFCEILKLLI